MGVSASSVSLWVRDIPLTAEQEAALDARNPTRNAQLSGARVFRERRRAERLAAQEHGRRMARRGDPLHVQGAMLYWAEGTKRRNSVELTNADADLVGVFLRFLRECHDVAAEQFTLTVNCHLGNGLSIDEIHAWWLQRLGLPEACLRTPAVNRPSSASRRRRPRTLPYGTVCLAVHSTFIVQSIYGAIQEYAGIDRPEWLDL